MPSDLDLLAIGDATTLGSREVHEDALPAPVPVRIGRYLVIAHIGSGGMGVVYSAYDPELDRKVAVKLVRAGRDGSEGQARLLREARMVARLSHVNIVAVHDAGVIRDQVYIVMEFLQGVAMDVWCAQRPGAWTAILSVLLRAGRGLEAAHMAGIVHRDFKPQNVFVTPGLDVKVLDFGLARTSESSLASGRLRHGSDGVAGDPQFLDTEALSRAGALLGTPAYMSPEQRRGEMAGAASDQFSFCVAAYECLYGMLPSLSASLQGRVTPPPPRSPVPARVYRALRRGLMTDPGERFGSMTELLAALERDPGARYRRWGVAVGAATLTGVLGFGMAGGGGPAIETCPDAHAELAEIWSGERAAALGGSLTARLGERGTALLALVEPRIERYAEGWVQLRNEACRTHAEGRQSDPLFDRRTACLEQRRAGLGAVVEVLAQADAGTLDRVAQATAELPPLETCADTRALMADVPPPEDAKLQARVQSHRETLARAQVHEDAGQYRAGLALVEGVLADGAALAYEPLLAEALLHKGSLQMEGSEHAAAEQTLSQALWAAFAAAHERVAAQASSKRIFLRAALLGRASQALAEIPEVQALNRRVRDDVELYAEFLNNIAMVAMFTGDVVKARQRFEESLALLRAHHRGTTMKALFTQGNLGELESMERRYQDAVASYRRAVAESAEILGQEHPRHLLFRKNVAENLAQMGRLREALAEMHQIEPLFAKIDSSNEQGMFFCVLGHMEIRAGELGAANRHLERSLQLIPESSFWHDVALHGFILIAGAEHDLQGVRRYHDRAVARLGQPLDPNDYRYPQLLLEHGRALATLGRPGEAAESLTLVRTTLAGSSVPQDIIQAALAGLELGRVRLGQGELDEAQEAFDGALTGMQGRLPDNSLEQADVMQGLGEVALQRQQYEDAVRWLTQAEAIYVEQAEADHPVLARIRFAQARASTGTARRASAEALGQAELALQALRAWSRDDEAGAVQAWLREHA